MGKNRDDYRQLCRDREGEIALMARDWWLDAVSAPAGKEWDAVLLRDADGSPLAAMPYQVTRRGPFTAMLMPQLTQHMSIWTHPDGDRERLMDSLLKRLRRTMLRRLTLMAQFAAHMPPSEEMLLREAGFRTQRRVTYVIAPTTNSAALLSGMHDYKRRNVRKGERLGLTMDTDMSAADFYAAMRETFAQRGSSMEYSQEMLTSLHDAAAERGLCHIFRATLPDGSRAAAAMAVHDGRRLFFLASSITPELAHCKGLEWLTYQMILWASERGMTFDFEGSMIPSVADSYRRFGATKEEYVFGEWGVMRALMR